MFENHVTPDALFDPEVAGPPADAFDVQFRTPLSLGIYVDYLHAEGRRREVADLQAFYEQLITERIVRRTQEMCGRVGEREPARLAITAVVEPGIAGVDGFRPHAHIYVGGTATRLVDEQRGPVAEGRLRQGLFGAVWPLYSRAVERGTADRYGLTWARVVGGLREIVDPPLAERVADVEQAAVCRGPWDPRRLVLADESYLAAAAEAEALRAHQQAIGLPGA